MISKFTNRDLQPIAEAYMRMICEDVEGKNINRAEKFVKQNHPEIIGKQLQNGTTMTPRIFTQEIRNLMPNVRLANCKFLLGVSRIYFDEFMRDTANFQRNAAELNKLLKVIASDAHVNEYDHNLNGLTMKQLEEKFSGAVRQNLQNDMDAIASSQYQRNIEYDIVKISDYEEASKYGQYTSWCVTHYPNMFDNYTNDGMGLFYFCLRRGFEQVPRNRGEGCPMDDYGKSMIAISVNDDGSLNTCTCRWNHDNGGNDNMMTTKEISDFFGVNFYDTFKPRDANELFKQYEEKSVESPFARRMGWLCVPSEDAYGQYEYVTMTHPSRNNPQPRIVKYRQVYTGHSDSYSGNIIGIASDHFYWYSINGYQIGTPNEIDGGISCSKWSQLTSLKGCPKIINGRLDCSECNNLENIYDLPDKLDGVDFYGCEKLKKEAFSVLADRPGAIKGLLFKGDSSFEIVDGKATALIDAEDIKSVYADSRSSREDLSWDFVKGILLGEDTWDLFTAGEMPDFNNLDDGDFNKILSEYDVTWGDIGRIYEGEYDEVDNPEVLTEYKCDRIKELLEDDFCDGIGIYQIWERCQIDGMYNEAYDGIVSDLFSELSLDKDYGVRDGKVKVSLDRSDIEKCFKIYSEESDRDILELLRTDEEYPDDIEKVSVTPPYYGYSDFDDKEWRNAIDQFAQKVIAIIEKPEPPKDSPGQMTFDFG